MCKRIYKIIPVLKKRYKRYKFLYHKNGDTPRLFDKNKKKKGN